VENPMSAFTVTDPHTAKCGSCSFKVPYPPDEIVIALVKEHLRECPGRTSTN